MFAVTCVEWSFSQEFQQAVADRMNHQEEREKAFLEHKGDCFAIYQLRRGDDLRDLRFEPLETLQNAGERPLRGNYEMVYTAPLNQRQELNAQLDMLYERFNMGHPADYRHRSMSVSDIVAIKRDGVVSCHYCDSVGFAEIPDFINQKPTVAKLEAQVKAGQTIPLTDLADVVHRERGQKTSVVAQLKSQPLQERQRTAPKKSAEKER